MVYDINDIRGRLLGLYGLTVCMLLRIDLFVVLFLVVWQPSVLALVVRGVGSVNRWL